MKGTRPLARYTITNKSCITTGAALSRRVLFKKKFAKVYLSNHCFVLIHLEVASAT